MAIYVITAHQIRKIPETTFSLAGLRERYDLQRLLSSQFDAISPDTLIIAAAGRTTFRLKESFCAGIINLGTVPEFSQENLAPFHA